MNIVKKLSPAISMFVTLAVPAFAGVTVNSPSNSASVGDPFQLSANASSCSSQSIAAMGYSLDNSSDTTIVNSSSVQASVAAGGGTHTLHVKAWGDQGAVCVTDVSIDVTSAARAEVAPNAQNISNIETLSNWKETHDSGTPGGSSGSMSLTNSPSRSGSARRFVTNYSHYGGERYQVSFGDDTTATNFLYDGWFYVANSASGIANFETDLNQVMPNGWTVIYGFQCDGWSGTWDFTANKGTPENYKDSWVHTGAHCNPREWSPNTWHHLQISYSRNDSGYVTYHSVTFDGAQSNINATVLSAFSLGWAPTLLTNLQIDGSSSGSGSSNVVLDQLTISRW